MQIIANFSYAGTSKYVSHAVENECTLCGMSVDELFARRGQEWDYVDEENYLGRERLHTANDVGCVKCSRLLTQRAPDLGQAVANDDNQGVAPSG